MESELVLLQCGAPRSIAKLVHITPMSLWFMVLKNNYSYGRYKPTNITGGPHIVLFGTRWNQSFSDSLENIRG